MIQQIARPMDYDYFINKIVLISYITQALENSEQLSMRMGLISQQLSSLRTN